MVQSRRVFPDREDVIGSEAPQVQIPFEISHRSFLFERNSRLPVDEDVRARYAYRVPAGWQEAGWYHGAYSSVPMMGRSFLCVFRQFSRRQKLLQAAGGSVACARERPNRHLTKKSHRKEYTP